MKELRDILQAIEAGRARGEKMALATIVGVQGSTYRREGARLLVDATGQMTGNISGGRPGGGGGGGGGGDVWVEPVQRLAGFLENVRRALDEEATVALAVVVRGTASVPAGTRLVLAPA